jgi:hypothetical protein
LTFAVTTKFLLWEYTRIIMDVQIRLMIIYRRGVLVMSGVFPNYRVTQLMGVMTLRYFWNCQCVDRRKLEKFRGDPKVVRRVPEGVWELWGII